MNELNPKSPREFTNELKLSLNFKQINYEEYFKSTIDEMINFAIGPYIWLIPNQFKMELIAASPNIHQLTPYSQNDWIGKAPDFFAMNFHPDDRNYVLSAVFIAIEAAERAFENNTDIKIRVNIYGRMLDANNEYKWRLIQFPKFYIGQAKRVESGLILITDISHLKYNIQPMMTIIDGTNKENTYFKINLENHNFLPLGIPKITKREQEILLLISKGLNTPQILEKLNIAYSTVENHKKNLRKKTNTKTTAELISFALNNNLF